jgi:Spy/CpxP family protein refolding chaperone
MKARALGVVRMALVAVAGIGVCVTAVAASAQQAGPPWSGGQRQGRGPTGAGVSVQEIERQFDLFEVVEARKALGMDEEAFRPVEERLGRIQSIRRRHQGQRRTILRDLRSALDSGAVEADEAAVTSKLAELSGLGVRQAQEMRRAHQALDAVLTVRQRAEFRVFQERFERMKLDLLARARQGRGRGGLPPASR